MRSSADRASSCCVTFVLTVIVWRVYGESKLLRNCGYFLNIFINRHTFSNACERGDRAEYQLQKLSMPWRCRGVPCDSGPAVRTQADRKCVRAVLAKKCIHWFPNLFRFSLTIDTIIPFILNHTYFYMQLCIVVQFPNLSGYGIQVVQHFWWDSNVSALLILKNRHLSARSMPEIEPSSECPLNAWDRTVIWVPAQCLR